MRWSSYCSPVDGTRRVGLLHEGSLHGLQQGVTLIELIGDADRLRAAAREARREPSEVLDPAAVQLLAPIPVPPSIRDFMAFDAHMQTSASALGHEVGAVWFEQPVFYFSNPAAVRGPTDDVAIAPGSTRFDFELEVAAIIGRPGADLRVAEAADHIAGFVVLCDWSARDLQKREMLAMLGPAKGKDSATSLSGWLVSPDELEAARDGDSYSLEMTASVNGRAYSSGNLSTMYWSFPELLAYASRGTELRTGDVIGSGTVGTGCILELSRVHGNDAYPWLKSGDEVRLEVEELGTIEAHILPSPSFEALR